MSKAFQLPDTINAVVVSIAAAAKLKGGEALIVGGWVRDQVLHHLCSMDVDIEVYGMSIECLEDMLTRLELEYDAIGRSFGILKLKDHPIDVSVPRRENRIGISHTDFACEFDPDMTPEDAALRRDFTMNSMYWDPLNHIIYDPYNGAYDLMQGVLSVTNESTFDEDPLRILRAMQFISRFGLKPEPELIAIGRALAPEAPSISKERVFEEWKKMLLHGKHIGDGLRFLADTKWICWYPELWNLMGLEQEHEWHPEGDAWVHICHCMDAFANLHIIGPNYDGGQRGRDFDKLVVGFGTLLHDVGKPPTTEHSGDRIRARRHDKVGVDIAERFMRRMTNWEELIEAVKPMVGEHMFTANFNKQQMSRRGVRRLARRCHSIDLLAYVITCDKMGRPPMEADLSDVASLTLMAQELDVYNQAPKPIMMGRHLIELGFTPGIEFKEILDACQDAEDDGIITDVESGMRFIQERFCDSEEDLKGEG